ncbi:Excinuclease ABC subunit B [Desulfonauticus submarinus]|uniref:UvrABC system protein B n=1 Tax=Desulfonauticus submarinus TaxID=206665 RepID=A0A1H0FGN5_9BACT|nr:excinuclease ABC subunit UvrB [Desulfonauticus submarinus]SDN93833.1 Excinuclease ABC subunit B [Desulfonauticus submarinus]
MRFKLKTNLKPKGDQPQAITSLVQNLNQGIREQVLLGVTGSGKTFTMANVIAQVNKPALIIAPNKTLAAQLYSEFKSLFPENAVEHFVSYYDYYQPEAYLPHQDIYIEKDSSINEEIDKLRHAATHSLLTRKDVIIVASVSCIYGLGSPEYYSKLIVPVEQGQKIDIEHLISRLIEVQYERNEYDFKRGTFRIRGDVLEIIPSYMEDKSIRIEFFGDEIDNIYEIDSLTGEVIRPLPKTIIFPASHYVSDRENLKRAMIDIREELRQRLEVLNSQGKLLEAKRLEERTLYDLEMMEELGYCKGIENYSRHLDGRKPGEPPACLLNYFPKDFILFIDESHITIPQIRGMYNGDRSRKQTLVEFGFRLPSALDNRPLNFKEFLNCINQCIYVSATPGDWELERSTPYIIEQIIRPTGLLDPEIEVRPTANQIPDLIQECVKATQKQQKILITTLTKRLAEDLSEFLDERGLRCKYMHSDIDTLERVNLIQGLRTDEFDILIGINLLREGLDLPEVALIAILDADKEGFLRSFRSLIQIFGRAARNVNGKVIMYADKITPAMQQAIYETNRRRKKQQKFNQTHNITPTTIKKQANHALYDLYCSEKDISKEIKEETTLFYSKTPQEIEKEIKKLEKQMNTFAKNLEFEKAAQIRDKILRLKDFLLKIS